MPNPSNPQTPADSRTAGTSSNRKSTSRPRTVRQFAPINQTPPVAEPWWKRIRRHLHTVASATGSLGLHLLLLLIMVLFVISSHEPETIGVTAVFTEPDHAQPVLQPAEQDIPIDLVTKDEQVALVEREFESTSTSDDLPVPVNTLSKDPDSEPERDVMGSVTANAPEQPMPVGGGFEGRVDGARGALAARFGGNAASELAVENGLKWLIDHQFPDGSWRLQFAQGSCDGRCGDPALRESTTAATGLSLMALLGAGYTHHSGPYQQQVQQGLDYLKSRMRESQFGGNLAEGTMYAQGIATIALSEAYSMTGDDQLLPFVESAMKYIVTAQHDAGGWRYNPGQPGDITVTGWQMMALKSCQLAGLDPPQKTIRQARTFLSSVGDDSSGLFGYQNKEPDPTSTAIGLLLQLYQGWSPEHRGLVQGTDYLVELGPSRDNIYFNYYATQVLFHCHHQQWESWNREIRDYLVQTQSQTGHESGSWFFPERYGSVGGRLYTTAMAVLILEVYYRYLPLYDRELVRRSRSAVLLLAISVLQAFLRQSALIEPAVIFTTPCK